jgi:hypothetical protein
MHDPGPDNKGMIGCAIIAFALVAALIIICASRARATGDPSRYAPPRDPFTRSQR